MIRPRFRAAIHYIKILSYALLLWGGMLFMAPAQSLNSPVTPPTDTLTDTNLGTVVVQARPNNAQLSVIPAQKLSGKELQAMSNFSIADALKYFSGVQVKDYGGIGGIKTINIRSMGSQHVGVFYDGIELGNAQNGQIDLGQYSLDNMEAIELFNGQKSGYLQPAKDFGSAGTVYLRTRRPVFTDGRRTNLKLSYKTGSFQLANPTLLIEQRLMRDLSASLNAEWVRAGGRYKFRYRRALPGGAGYAYDTTAVRQNGDIDALRLEGNLFGTLPNGTWTLKGYHYGSNRGIPGAIVNNVWSRGERLDDSNTFAQATYNQEITPGYQLAAKAKYAYYFTHYKNSDPKVLFIEERYHQREFYASLAQSLLLLPGWHLSLAYDYQWNKLTSTQENFVLPIRHTHLLALSSTYTSSIINAQASLLGTFIQDKIQNLSAPKPQRKLTPALFLSLTPWEEVDLRFTAFAKRSLRMPTFNDLYYINMGNRLLKPEVATQYNVGLDYTQMWPKLALRTLQVSLQGYYNHIKDKIVAYPKGDQFRWTYLNLGLVQILGLDALVGLGWQPLPGWEVTSKIQYTFQRATDVTSPQTSYYKHQIPYVPVHSGSLALLSRYRGWDLSYSFVYVGERYNQQENIPANYTQPWYTHDLSLGKELRTDRAVLRMQLDCNNLLAQDYDVIANYPMPLRNYRFTLSITF